MILGERSVSTYPSVVRAALLSIIQLFHPGKRIHENLLLLSGFCTVGAKIFNRGSKNSAGDFQKSAV